MDNFGKIFSNEALNSAINELLNRFIISRFLGVDTQGGVEGLTKAGWFASILAESSKPEHKEKAQLFAILVHLNNKVSNETADKLSYVILSRVGNLLSTKFLLTLFSNNISEINSFKYQFGEALNMELLQERRKRIITIDEKEILTTDFQLDLWKKLSSGGNISISAPTSAGKSYIIQNHILELFKREKSIQGLYMVPTKALINQASEDLLEILPNVEVRTSFIEEERIENAEGEGLHPSQYFPKIMYVLTPERCLKLLQNAYKVGFYPQIIFIDEIQNIEDLHGRGVLFEYVLESISALFPTSKIITAGPFIKNEKEVFQEVFKLENISCKTDLAPVLQLKTIVRSSKSEGALDLFVYEKSLRQSSKIKIPAQFNLNKELKHNKGTGFAKVVLALSKEGQKNIVYCPQTNYVENWALKLEEVLYHRESPSPPLRELIDFLAEEIHPKYLLIKCLKKGIAFHHSKLPDIVRKEIEELFKQGELENLYCTSTLLQGVNLPAHNLFITKPRKRNDLLSPFEFGNLIGRAGRIRDSLYGIIYCVEGESEDDRWAEDFYKSSYEKNITTATRKSLEDSDSLLSNIEKTSKEIKEDSVSYALTILRQKFLASPEQFLNYLVSKDVKFDVAGKMLNGIAKSLENLKIDSALASLNPTIDPILQNILFNKIKEEGIESWVIIPNSNFYKKIGRDNVDLYSYQDLSFYWQLAILCEKLDSILKIREEAYFKQDISLSIRQIAYYGFRWLQNRSLKEIIIDDINFNGHKLKNIDPENDDDVNTRIKSIINIHSKVVTYLLVKYFKLLVDLLEAIMTENEREKFKFTLSLPIMLELGTTEPIVIQLISAGITRSVALRVFSEFKKHPNYKELDVFVWMKNENSLRGIDNIYLRYLKKLKFVA